MACIPRAELLANLDAARSSADALRPLTMTTTGERLLAWRVNDELALVASRTVAPPHRGSLRTAIIAGDIAGLDGIILCEPAAAPLLCCSTSLEHTSGAL